MELEQGVQDSGSALAVEASSMFYKSLGPRWGLVGRTLVLIGRSACNSSQSPGFEPWKLNCQIITFAVRPWDTNTYIVKVLLDASSFS